MLVQLLFLLYVNYITKDINGPWAAYADDSNLSVNKKQDAQDIQNMSKVYLIGLILLK